MKAPSSIEGYAKSNAYGSRRASSKILPPHTKCKNESFLPLEGFPDPPYSDRSDNTEIQPVHSKLCSSFKDILNSAERLDCSSAVSRSSTPSQSSQSGFISLVNCFIKVRNSSFALYPEEYKNMRFY